jgi:hypothetical protein
MNIIDRRNTCRPIIPKKNVLQKIYKNYTRKQVMKELLNLYLIGLKPVTIISTLFALDVGVANLLNEPLKKDSNTTLQLCYLTCYTFTGVVIGITYPVSLPILFTIFCRRLVNQIKSI